VLTIPRPDDWHCHLRDGAALARTVADTARCFARALVMPNLDPPVTTVAAALAYRERILAARPAGVEFTPLMTLYLTEQTPVAEIERAAASGAVLAFKLYPAGATTGSARGVRDLGRIGAQLEALERHDLVLSVHGESVAPQIDVFDREAHFVEHQLAPLIERFAGLRVVLEHLSSRAAVEFVAAAPPRVAATITAHHLLLTRNDLLAGGLRPHHYCAPLLKRERDREALVAAACGDDASFFLGTDSAPHPRGAKLAPCGCAGIYSAPAALELYAEVFAAAGALERLEAFAARRGAAFYRLAPSAERLTLEPRPWTVPDELALGADVVVPLRAGEALGWRVSRS